MAFSWEQWPLIDDLGIDLREVAFTVGDPFWHWVRSTIIHVEIPVRLEVGEGFYFGGLGREGFYSAGPGRKGFYIGGLGKENFYSAGLGTKRLLA